MALIKKLEPRNTRRTRKKKRPFCLVPCIQCVPWFIFLLSWPHCKAERGGFSRTQRLNKTPLMEDVHFCVMSYDKKAIPECPQITGIFDTSRFKV